MSGPFCLIGDGIVHSRTKARCPPINGIAERFHKTVLDEFYRIAFRKKFHAIVDRMQSDYGARTRQSRWFYGKTPLAGCLGTAHLTKTGFLHEACPARQGGHARIKPSTACFHMMNGLFREELVRQNAEIQLVVLDKIDHKL